MDFFKGKSARMTLPRAKKVHGVEIKKVPIGRYIESMSELQSLPAALLEACFPDKRADQILDEVSLLDKDSLVSLATRLFLNAPTVIIDAFAVVTGESKAKLMELTPKELMDVVMAWWALNDLTEFFRGVWETVKPKLQTSPPTDGFKDGSQSQPA